MTWFWIAVALWTALSLWALWTSDGPRMDG